MKLLLPLLFLALVVAVYGANVDPKTEDTDDATEYRLRRHWRQGYRRLGRYVNGRWWFPWYDSEDKVPEDERESLKQIGQEIGKELEEVGDALEDAESGDVSDDEASAYRLVRPVYRCDRRKLLGLPCRRHHIRNI